MSREIQRRARDRRDRAAERAESARERADRNRERGNPRLARLHREAAEAQASAARTAEGQRVADVEVEGEQLGEPEHEVPVEELEDGAADQRP